MDGSSGRGRRNSYSFRLSEEECAAAGVPEGLIHYAVGIEDFADLKEDLEQALGILSWCAWERLT